MENTKKQLFWVGIGGLVGAISINLFLIPHHLLSGGVGGIAIILHFLNDYPVGLQVIVLNIPLFYAAYRYIGPNHIFSTLYGMLIFSFSVDATSFLANINLVDDPMLAALYGGVLSGLGSGIIFRVNGNTGGLDIVAAIAKKYYSLNVGAVGFCANCLIMSVAGLLFGAKLAMLTLISMYVCGIVTDKVVEGYNRKKTVIIISDLAEQIAEIIINEIGRGVTFLQGQGAFTLRDKRIIFVVVNLTQIARIKMLIEAGDPLALMIVQDAAEVMGPGFTIPKRRVNESNAA
ncbi:MAG: YitT family protein [Negativicutes bacterium]